MRVDQINCSLKARVLGDRGCVSYPCLNIGGHHVFRVHWLFLSDLYSALGGEECSRATSVSRNGKSYARIGCRSGRCLLFSSSGPLLSMAQVLRMSWMTLCPMIPQSPNLVPFKKNLVLEILALSHWVLSWQATFMWKFHIFMWKMHVITHCPHEQHKAGSRMELEFAFQLLNLKQKSNTSSQSVKGRLYCVRSHCTIFCSAFSSCLYTVWAGFPCKTK